MSESLPKVALARHLRKNLTEPEWQIWHRLKQRDEAGLVFRRQHAMGPYVLDFYCFKARLCIEIDGARHGFETQQQRDMHRDQWLEAQGIEVYRITADEVYKDADAVADGVKLKALSKIAPA